MSNDQPLSRREARERRKDAGATEAADRPSELDEAAHSVEKISDDGDRTRKRRRRRWTAGMSLVVVVGLLVGGGLAAKRLYDQAMVVRGHLEAAITEVATVKQSVLAGDLESAAAASGRLSAETNAAVAGSHGRLWGAAEMIPFVGDNLSAVRVVAEVTDQLASDVVAPVSSLTLDSFRPQNGRIDLEAVSALGPLLDQVSNGLDDATITLESLNRDDLIDQVASGVTQLDDALADIEPMIDPVRDVVSVLPDALGASGPRNYLLMFQGNSEARSLGGNAAIFIVMRAENGTIDLIDQATSFDFEQPAEDPVAPLDPEAVAIFGDKIGRFTPDFTMVPDFPQAVDILMGWWAREKEIPIDAVMSFDPVALSYLLDATGPITLPTGDVLSSQNAASLLLNEVYFKYENPLAQDVFFASAAGAVFSQVTGGNFAPLGLINALSRSADERRLLYHSNDPAETELIAGTPMSGTLPTDNTDRSVVGVYVNDNTGSKKSYYLDMSIDACLADANVQGTVTLSSTLNEEDAANLPTYIAGPYFEPGEISTYLVLYGPVASELKSVTVDGKPANILSSGTQLGRSAVKLEVLSRPLSTHTISFAYEGAPDGSGDLAVQHTPMTRDTSVIVKPRCGS